MVFLYKRHVYCVASIFWFHLVVGLTCDDRLLLTPLIRNGDIILARNLSAVNTENIHMESYTGFITVDEKFNSNLFFWFFPGPDFKLGAPWIVWLQGGPGISSLMGVFDSIGPLVYEEDKLKLRNVTWATNYSLLFIDNPVGAGFSFTMDDHGYPDNENAVGEQLFEFLQQFLQVFPELQTAPLFIAGESYAGKYVPALGIQIHRRKNSNIPINLKGLAIGNGLIDPKSMMHYDELCSALGLLDEREIDKVKQYQIDLLNYIEEEKWVDAANEFNKTIEYIKKHSGVSIYNFNNEPNIISANFEKHINKPQFRKLIHVGNASFNLNNQYVYHKMLPDVMKSTKHWVEQLLKEYGVMCYSGQLDVILPYGLSRHLYAALNWTKRGEYERAPRKKLFATGKIVGYKRSGGNFVEVLIRNAGHMVPTEQPEVIKLIMDAFIKQFRT